MGDFDYLTAVRLFIEKGFADLEAETIEHFTWCYDKDRKAWQLVKPKGKWYSTIEEAVNAYLSDYEPDDD